MSSSRPPLTSLDLVQSIIVPVHSRRLLLQASIPASVPVSGTVENGFDANVVMILAVLLCALICALGVNTIVRCALRCSNRMALEPVSSPAAARLTILGARRKALKSLPVSMYSAEMKLSGAGSECAICLSDFAPGERIRVLPKCSHGFHVRCIDRWLMARPSCPTCRQCLFGTCQKVSGCAEASTAVPAQSVILPLEPEGLINSYR